MIFKSKTETDFRLRKDFHRSSRTVFRLFQRGSIMPHCLVKYNFEQKDLIPNEPKCDIINMLLLFTVLFYSNIYISNTFTANTFVH